MASFRYESARRGFHPQRESPATAMSQEGQPDASEGDGVSGRRGRSVDAGGTGGGQCAFSSTPTEGVATAACRVLKTQPIDGDLHEGREVVFRWRGDAEDFNLVADAELDASKHCGERQFEKDINL